MSYGKLSAFFAGEQLGFRHVVRNSVRRIVKRELIPQSPSEDAAAQNHQREGKAAQASASIDGKALRLFRGIGRSGIQCSRNDDATRLGRFPNVLCERDSANSPVSQDLQSLHADC